MDTCFDSSLSSIYFLIHCIWGILSLWLDHFNSIDIQRYKSKGYLHSLWILEHSSDISKWSMLAGAWCISRHINKFISIVKELLKESGSWIFIKGIRHWYLWSNCLIAYVTESKHFSLTLLLWFLLLWLNSLNFVLCLIFLNKLELYLYAPIFMIVWDKVLVHIFLAVITLLLVVFN